MLSIRAISSVRRCSLSQVSHVLKAHRATRHTTIVSFESSAMIRTSKMMDQVTIDKRHSAASIKDASNLKLCEPVSCTPDSALKSFSPYACDTESIGTCSSDYSDLENEREDAMPPPSPYKPNSSGRQFKDGFQLGVMSTLSRPRSASPKRDGGMPQGRGMQRIRSLPNMDYGRSSYNRGIGLTMLESVAEYDKANGKVDCNVSHTLWCPIHTQFVQ